MKNYDKYVKIRKLWKELLQKSPLTIVLIKKKKKVEKEEEINERLCTLSYEIGISKHVILNPRFWGTYFEKFWFRFLLEVEKEERWKKEVE